MSTKFEVEGTKTGRFSTHKNPITEVERLKTSEQWSQEDDTIVYDPDGWDRSDQRAFMHSWYEEEITKEEYERRKGRSTLIPKPDIKMDSEVKSIFKEA
jgi:hypothetical protein